MLFIHSESFEAPFNLAAEEFLLKNIDDDICFIYRNSPCVVVGKHQNALAEINFNFIKNNKIGIFRRISGGGAVYHDEGNLNLCFIRKGEQGKLIDFSYYTRLFIDFLKNANIDAKEDARHNIFIGDKKISGNAEHIYKNKTLHHGTLLYSSNLENLKKSLSREKNPYTDRAIKSVKNHVDNISNHLKVSLSVDRFETDVCQYLQSHFKTIPFNFKEIDLHEINKLSETKYNTWEWNYGYSPAYSFSNEFAIENKTLKIEFQAEKGILKNITIQPKNISDISLHKLEEKLTGARHHFDEIKEKISGLSAPSEKDAFWNEFVVNMF